MDFEKIIKYVLLLSCMFYFFPSFSNGIFTFILKMMLYMFSMYICYIVINDSVNFIFKHWGKLHLLWIDEREHARRNTLAELSRMDLFGASFRLIHYINFNKKKMLQGMWYDYLENIAVVTTFILFFLIIIGFVLFRSNFIS